MKRVTVTLKVDSEFVSLLHAAVHLAGLGPDRAQHTPIQALAVVFLAEAMGALPEQVHALTPIEWRPHIEAVSDARVVEVVA